MSKTNIPDYDPSNVIHKYIWEFLAYDLTDKDFETIEEILKTRKEDRERIDRSDVFYSEFVGGRHMFQPLPLKNYVKEGAYRYTNWEAATDILMVLSKYTSFS